MADDIPEDVMKAAQEQWVAATKDLEPGDVFSNIDIVARGIMAERERCASIVGNWPQLQPHQADIAAAIRKASETGKAA